MSNNLAYVLSRVSYGRITDSKFKAAADTVVEALRKDYPSVVDSNEMRMVEVQVGPQGQQVKETVIPMIVLTSATKDWGVRIAPDYVLLHTNNYQSFENFKGRMIQLLDVVSQAMSIYHTGFVGIRYINKFQADENEGFDNFFRRKEFLQPIMSDMMMAGSNLSSRYETADGWLSLNSGVSVNASKLPGELLEIAADLGEKNSPLQGPWAHLDADSYFSPNNLVEYDRDGVIAKLTLLRTHAKRVYQQIIKDDAMDLEQ